MPTNEIARSALALIVGYLLGGIPFGLIVPRMIGGPDPRTIGSGRIGGANVSRAVGYRWALVSGLLDVAKAVVAVLLMAALGGGAVPQVLAALAAIVGHSRSPYIGFHGGRGVAPAAGGGIILAPWVVLAILPIFVIGIALTRITSVGSLSASAAGGVIMLVATAVVPLAPILYLYGLAVPGLIWYFHRDNIQRLLAGQERQIAFGPRRSDTAAGPGRPPA
jgi:glycerol-3-phosphate acyltransferase PlsY